MFLYSTEKNKSIPMVLNNSLWQGFLSFVLPRSVNDLPNNGVHVHLQTMNDYSSPDWHISHDVVIITKEPTLNVYIVIEINYSIVYHNIVGKAKN